MSSFIEALCGKKCVSKVTNGKPQDFKELQLNVEKCWSRTDGLDIANFILSKCIRVNNGWDIGHQNFDLLKEVLDELSGSQKQIIFERVLPMMQHRASSASSVVECLSTGKSKVSINRMEILSLLANCFFCCFPRDRGDKEKLYNFSHLYEKQGWASSDGNRVKKEKIKCLLSYFANATEHLGEPIMLERVTFCRNVVYAFPDWVSSTKQTQALEIVDDKMTSSVDMPRVDFANKRIGGGVLAGGSLQEEIMFITCPELIAARFFSAEMKDNEAIIIDGVRQYSTYEGYADTFRYTGQRHAEFESPFQVVAMDALNFSKEQPFVQFTKKSVDRELNKAYAAFSGIRGLQIASGNWGGGCYKGDPILKAKIQMIAASQAGVTLKYFTFRNPGLESRIKNCVNGEMMETVGKEYRSLLDWCKKKRGSIFSEKSLKVTSCRNTGDHHHFFLD